MNPTENWEWTLVPRKSEQLNSVIDPQKEKSDPR
jgi:hypothetical protein